VRCALLRCASVGRFQLLLAIAFSVSATVCVLVHAQVSDEEKEKRVEFLKARASASATPDASPSPSAVRKTAKHKSKAGSPSPKPKTKSKEARQEAGPAATPKETPEATAKPKSSKKKTSTKETPAKAKKKKKTATPEKTPRKTTSVKPAETPLARETTPVPHAVAVPVPSAPPAPAPTITAPVEAPEQLTIEKYGYEQPRSFWSRLFGRDRSRSGTSYRYLTASVRAAIDRAPVARGRWQYIVVHNSGTRQGNAAVFDYYHRHVRRMQNGLAYHFVIGNGTSTGNGQIEVGDRWRRQINGGHVHSDYLNNIALGICLVGDFNRNQPTRAQLDSCEELIRYLRQRCGKIDNHYPIVKPHREMNPPRWPTDCPGDVFPYSWFRRF
jgi:outer membrane biosynthesis protein TonB